MVQPCFCISKYLLVRLPNGRYSNAEEKHVHEKDIEVLGGQACLVYDVEGSNDNIGQEREDQQSLQVVDDLAEKEKRKRHRVKYPWEEKQFDECLADDNCV